MILIVKILAFLLLITHSLVFSQKDNGSINAISDEITHGSNLEFIPEVSIFKKFENNISFLNKKVLETEYLSAQIDTLYSNNLIRESDGKKIEQHYLQLHNSFQDFTDFNVKKLHEISERLVDKKPLKGCEISYLNKSFYTYKKYVECNNMIQKNKKDKSVNLLHLQLNQLIFFYKNYYNSLENKQIRRVLNSEDVAYKIEKNDLKKIALKQLRRKNYKTIQKGIHSSQLNQKNDLVIDSILYNSIKNTAYNKSSIRKDKRKIRRLFNKDKAHNSGRTIIHQFSGLMGNFMGLFKFRKGFLNKNDSILNEISNRLKPMDIIGEKTNFTLTDKLIIGHFSHIAIWLGTPKQLQESNLWNHPSIVPFHKYINEGFCILENDRKGTHLKKLIDFLNVDELAIMRIQDFEQLSIDYKTVIYENALAQLGKKYDFNFDLETTNKLTCSELIYYVFGSIHWPNEHYFNRATISPDNILSLTLYKNTPASLIYYVSAKNRKTIFQKSLLELSKDLGYQKIDNAFIPFNKKCDKERNRTKKKCTSANRILEYQ